MDKLVKESFIYRIIIKISMFFQKLFSESFLVNFFIKEPSNMEEIENTWFARIINRLLTALKNFAHFLRLDKLFDNSIFAKPMIWLSILMFLVPFLPTMLALGMLIIVAASLLLQAMITDNFHFKYFKANRFVIIFMILVMIAGFTSVSLLESKKIALLVIAFVFSFFVVINSVKEEKHVRTLLILFAIAGFITAIYGIYQYIFGDVFSAAWVDKENFEDIRMRVYATFDNPNVYGEYLILVIPCLLSLLWTEKGWFRKLIFLGMLGTVLLAAVLTFSRGCWLAILLEVAIMLVYIDRRFIILGIFGLMLMPIVLPDTIINRFMSIGNMADSSTSYRVYIWFGTIAMLKDYWISGVGVGNASFNAIYPLYSYNAVTAPHSHNLFLQLIVEYGIIGLLIFLCVIYNFFKETIISLTKKRNICLIAMVAGVIGFLLESLFDYTWYNYRVVLIFWMYLALGFAYSQINSNEVQESELSRKDGEND